MFTSLKSDLSISAAGKLVGIIRIKLSDKGCKGIFVNRVLPSLLGGFRLKLRFQFL